MGVGFRIIAIAALLGLSGVAQAAKAEQTAEQRYENGERFLKNGNYTRALVEFNYVRNYHRDDPISLKAELAIADLYYKKGDFEQAKLSYEDFQRLHPRNENIDWVVFRTGTCLFKRAPSFAGRDQTPTREAVNEWTGFDQRFPESTHKEEVAKLMGKARARLAKKEMVIAHFYQKREAWTAVQRRSEGLATKYPDAPQVPEALALAGIAYHRVGDEDDATRMRDQLIAASPDSKWVGRLDHVLAQPAGEPPKDEIFVRPYRMQGGAPAAAGGAAPQS